VLVPSYFVSNKRHCDFGKLNSCSEMFAILVILISVFVFFTAAENKWDWKNVVEPQCNSCKCHYKSPKVELKRLSSIFAKKRYMVMASKLDIVQKHIGFGNGGMIQTDQDLDAFAAFTFMSYFSRDMKKSYANWTLGETVSGSIVSSIRGNVMSTQLETGIGTSRKIQSIEDSLMGDGLASYNVLWADKTNILLVGCLGSKGYSGWSLFSTSRTLSRKTKKIVLEKISALGFKPNKAVVLPY